MNTTININSVSQNEHNPEIQETLWKLSVSTTMTTWYSKSVTFLFFFFKYNNFQSFILALFGLISFIPQLLYTTNANSLESSWESWRDFLISIFFVSRYSTGWLLWCQWILSVIWIIVSSLLYYGIVTSKQVGCGIPNDCFGNHIFTFLSQETVQDMDYEMDRIIIGRNNFRISQSESIETITTTTWWKNLGNRQRIFISATLFLLMLIIYGIVQAAIQYWILLSQPISLLFILIGSIIHTVWKSCWRHLCWYLSKWETHLTWSRFYYSYFIKVYLFDVISFGLFYLTRTLLLNELDFSIETQGDHRACRLDWLAQQFLWILVLDYFASRLGEFAIAKCQALCCLGESCLRWRQEKGIFTHYHRSDESLKYNFLVVEEYVRILLRQYYLLAGSFVVPMIGWIGFIFGIIDYWRALYALARLCARPRYSAESFVKILLIMIFVTIFLSVFSYPGFAWYFLSSIDSRGCPHQTWFGS